MAFFDDLFGRADDLRRALAQRPDPFGGGLGPLGNGLDAFGDLIGDGSDAIGRLFGNQPQGVGFQPLTSFAPAQDSFWQMPALGGDVGGFGQTQLPIVKTGIQPRGARSLTTTPADTFTPRRPGLFSKKPAAAAATTTTTGTTGTAASPGTAGEIWGVIDEEARDDPQLAQALKLAVQLESGGRADAVGDQGQSYGFYQIYQPAHGRNITPEQSRDPRASTRYRLAEFRAAKERVTKERPGLWESDPMEAAALTAFYAQRPAAMYGAANVQQAWQTIQQRQTAAPAPATPEAAQGLQAAAIAEAQRHIGKPYLLAAQANNPAANAFDCSGLVQWSYKTAGVALPRTAQEQYNSTQRVKAEEVRPGDLVFFHSTYDAGTPVTHVGIAMGNGQMLQAGSGGVGVVDLNTPYWRQHLYGFGRVA